MKIRSSFLLIFLLDSVVCTEVSAGRHADDHLIPFKPSIYDELRPTLYRKLCVTPANYGRMIELPPGPERAEWAVSVSCDEASLTGETCDVTLTRAAANLDYIMQERRGKDPLNAVNKVKVVRKHAPIRKTVAVAVRAAWLRFLRNSKPSPSRPNDPIALHAPKIEFWLVMPDGKAIKAEIPDRPGESVMTLINIGRLLGKYCEEPESQRASLAAQIELDANRIAATKSSKR
jgi:hypothetical protein